jgi:hypothetical protein
MAERDADNSAPNTMLNASSAFCHALSERLTAAGNYLHAARTRANPGSGSAPLQLLDTLDKALQQLDLTRQLVHRYRRILAEVAATQSRTGAPQDLAPDTAADPRKNPPPASMRGEGGDAGPTYRISFLNRLAKGDAMARVHGRAVVVCAARSADCAIETARQRLAERYGVDQRRIGPSIVNVELIDRR